MPLFKDPRDLSDPLCIFLVQVFIVLCFTRILGRLIRVFHQPVVVGEIIGGIILGPSVLGHIPGWSDTFFPKLSLGNFGLVSQLGLVFFMFFVGLEVDSNSMKQGLRSSFPIAIAAIVFPFIIGAVASLWLYTVNGNSVSMVSFVLFNGASMSFTAFPVLAAILHTFKLIDQPVGVLAFASAAINDVAAWCVLAMASAFVSSNSPVDGIYTTLLAIAFAFVMFFIIRPILVRLHPRLYAAAKDKPIAAVMAPTLGDTSGAVISPEEHLNHPKKRITRAHITVVFLVLLIASYISESIGIHAFFGAYIAGVIVPKEGGFVDHLAPKIESIVVDFFLPLYFVNNGLKLNLGSISTVEDYLTTVAIILIASFAKFVPTLLTTKCTTGQSWRFCATMGILMNTRGLVELIVLNVGLEQGILTQKLFAMMVVMAITTTAITPPIVHCLASGLPRTGAPVAAARKGTIPRTDFDAGGREPFTPGAPLESESVLSTELSELSERQLKAIAEAEGNETMKFSSVISKAHSVALDSMFDAPVDPGDGGRAMV